MAVQETAIQQSFMSRTKRFVRDVKAEMKKVNWPTRKEIIAHTGVVFVTVVLIAALIWAIDAVFAKALQFLIK
ncbi:preprotein translocase subunit SecE [Azotosporobacter soli]|jgi:preprotein translocase subunit SecE|uniref:preprotein translocase subunit SecE n=1 Tax=Azotosporobacter soli TaxID=3055040 RepID=UPI0031FE5E8A